MTDDNWFYVIRKRNGYVGIIHCSRAYACKDLNFTGQNLSIFKCLVFMKNIHKNISLRKSVKLYGTQKIVVSDIAKFYKGLKNGSN